MSNPIIIAALALLAGLVFTCLKLKHSLRMQKDLQMNLAHARNELNQQEAQSHEMQYEVTQLRIQISSLKVTVNQLEQYQDVLDIEQYVKTRRLQADSFIDMTKINAEIMLNELKDQIAKVQAFLAVHQQNMQSQIEKKAQEELKSYFTQVQAVQERNDILQALERKIHGYQQHYYLPLQQLQGQLIEGYASSDAAQHLLQVYAKIQNAIQVEQIANCHYLNENRRQAAIALVTMVFNAKAELYLKQLNRENLGQLLQALKDDYLLINLHGNQFSNAQLNESYLNLRLEELKFMALLQVEPA